MEKVQTTVGVYVDMRLQLRVAKRDWGRLRTKKTNIKVVRGYEQRLRFSRSRRDPPAVSVLYMG